MGVEGRRAKLWMEALDLVVEVTQPPQGAQRLMCTILAGSNPLKDVDDALL